MECMAKQQAFTTLKDHKENFKNKPTCRLINPAKSELGLASKKILQKINTNIRSTTLLDQWKNTSSVINCFENISEKRQHTFAIFNSESFYPSTSEDLLKTSINWAEQHTKISKQDIKIIMHSRKSLVFNKKAALVKKGDVNLFDVTMGSYDGAEVCELVRIYILHNLAKIYGKENIDVYRDDGLAAFNKTSGPQAERIKKELQKIFKKLGLKIEIKST